MEIGGDHKPTVDQTLFTSSSDLKYEMVKKLDCEETAKDMSNNHCEYS